MTHRVPSRSAAQLLRILLLIACASVASIAKAACDATHPIGQLNGAVTVMIPQGQGLQSVCFDVPDDGFLTLTVTSPGTMSPNWLYDSHFQYIYTCAPNMPLGSGTYYVDFVHGTLPSQYTLTSTYVKPSLPAAPEPNDTPATALPLALNSIVSGHLGFASTTDWWHLTTGQAGSLDCKAVGADFLWLPSIEVFHATGTTLGSSIGFNRGSLPLGNPTVEVTSAVTAGDYLVQLIGGETQPKFNAGGYTLLCQLTPAVAPPLASFSWTPSAPQSGQQVAFTDTSTGAPTGWQWTFGDGASSVNQSPSHTFASAGTYHVTLTARNAGGLSAATHDVVVTALLPAPKALFTNAPASPTAGQAITFTDASTGPPTSWMWSFGDGSTSSIQNPVHTYSLAGNYAVSLTVTNSSGTDSLSKTIPVAPAGSAPVASFTYSPASPKPGPQVTFTDTSSGTPTSWSWAFGDVGAASTPTTTHTFATAGTFTVALVVTNAFGSNSTSKQVTVLADVPAFTADFTYLPTNPTAGTPVQFTDHSAGNPSSWSWDFGDQGTSVERNPSHTFSAAGSYRVVLRAQNATTQDTATKTLTVSAAACTGGCITLSGNTRVLGIHRAGVAIQVAAANSLDVRLIDIHGQPTSYVAKVASDGSYTLTAPSASYSIVCDITYNDNVLQPATGAYLQVTRHAVQTKPVPSAPSNAIVDFVFPSPLVFLHGIRSDQTKWNTWTAGLGGGSPSRPDAIFFTPVYDYLADYGTEADSVDLQLTYDFKLFAAVPEFNVVAHSKGGVVARVVRGTTFTGAGIVNAVLLGTPNDGAECFTIPALIERYFPATQQLDPGYYHLSRCDLQALNADPRTGSWGSVNVLAIAGTKNLQTRATLDLWGGCINGPNDTFVPIESVFKMTFTAGNIPISTMFNGIVTPYTHLELGDGATLWMLDVIVFPFFGGTFSARCPYAYATPSASCVAPFPVDGALCYDGRGLTTSGCNLAARDRTLFGVTLTWSAPTTSFASPNAPSAAAGSFTGCGDVIQYATVRAEASAGVSVVGYQIYRSNSPITTVKPSLLIGYASGDQLSFIDSNPAAGTSYYAVTALYDSGESAPAQAAPLILTGRHRAVMH